MTKAVTLKGAKLSQGGRYFTEGSYRVRVGEFKVVKRRKGGTLFVMETEILESEGPLAQKKGRCNWTVKTDLDAAPGNILELMVACSGVDPRDAEAVEAEAGGDPEYWDNVQELALDKENNPFLGKLLDIEAWDVIKESGSKYTRCKFIPVNEEEKAA